MITIDKSKSIALYEQIYSQVKEEISKGYLKAGDKILGSRTLAKMLGVSRNTVDRAYLQLTLEGYIESRKNAGFYVLELPKVFSDKEKIEASKMKISKTSDDKNILYDLTNSSHTSNLFPKRVWKKHYQHALEHLEKTEEISTLQPFQGDLSLRLELCQYLERIRGVTCKPEQIIITSGLQQSLDYLCQFLKNENSSVLMEEPSYPKAREIFNKNHYDIVTAGVDDKGLNLDDVADNQAIDMIYTTPSHQFPMGMIMPVSRRYQLLEFAERNNSFILEDDYDSELRYYEKPVPSLKSIDYLDRVIYLGTFSKVLSPSFRMSYMVLPEPLTKDFLDYFQQFNSTVNLLNQVAVAQILESGDYDRIVRKMNQVFKKRYEAIKKGFSSFNHPIQLSHNVSGQYLLVTFPDKINQSEMIERALQEGVKVYDTMQFWQAKAQCPHQELFLGFSKIELEAIDDCIERLKRAWDKEF